MSIKVFTMVSMNKRREVMFENKNEWQKTKPVPIPFPRASRNFPNAKTRNEKKFDNWTLEIIPFI